MILEKGVIEQKAQGARSEEREWGNRLKTGRNQEKKA